MRVAGGTSLALALGGAGLISSKVLAGPNQQAAFTLTADGMTASGNPFVTDTLRGLDIIFKSPEGPLTIHVGVGPNGASGSVLINGADGTIASNYKIEPALMNALQRVSIDANGLLQAILQRDAGVLQRIYNQITAQAGSDFPSKIRSKLSANGGNPITISTKDEDIANIMQASKSIRGDLLSIEITEALAFSRQHQEFIHDLATLMPASTGGVNGGEGVAFSVVAGCVGCGLGGLAIVGSVLVAFATDGLLAETVPGVIGYLGGIGAEGAACGECAGL